MYVYIRNSWHRIKILSTFFLNGFKWDKQCITIFNIMQNKQVPNMLWIWYFFSNYNRNKSKSIYQPKHPVFLFVARVLNDFHCCYNQYMFNLLNLFRNQNQVLWYFVKVRIWMFEWVSNYIFFLCYCIHIKLISEWTT